MLEAEAIEHVAFAAAAAPGVLEQSAHVTEVLGQRGVGTAALALCLEPVKVVLAAERATRTPRRTERRAMARRKRAAHVDDRARGLASDLVEVAQIALDQRIQAVSRVLMPSSLGFQPVVDRMKRHRRATLRIGDVHVAHRRRDARRARECAAPRPDARPPPAGRKHSYAETDADCGSGPARAARSRGCRC